MLKIIPNLELRNFFHSKAHKEECTEFRFFFFFIFFIFSLECPFSPHRSTCEIRPLLVVVIGGSGAGGTTVIVAVIMVVVGLWASCA